MSIKSQNATINATMAAIAAFVARRRWVNIPARHSTVRPSTKAAPLRLQAGLLSCRVTRQVRTSHTAPGPIYAGAATDRARHLFPANYGRYCFLGAIPSEGIVEDDCPHMAAPNLQWFRVAVWRRKIAVRVNHAIWHKSGHSRLDASSRRSLISRKLNDLS